MPGSRTLAFAVLVGVAALTIGSIRERATGGCAGRLCRGLRLPAPITIAAGRVSVRIARDGALRRSTEPTSGIPRQAVWLSSTGTWYLIQRGHLLVERGRRPVWRSREAIGSPDRLGVLTASSRGIAFQHHHKLFLAPLRGAERPVAQRELPLGWTRDGLYTYRYRGRQLLLRSDTGALRKVIARQPLGSDYYVAKGDLYFVRHGALLSAHGARVERLAALQRLGLSATPSLQPVGRLVELQDDHRLVVVRANGSVFASTPLPLGQRRDEGISSSLVTAPNPSAVAFTAAFRPNGKPGTETVYVLHAGAHTATPVHREDVDFRPCERSASLQWHGSWILYSASEGNLAAINGAHRAIELRELAHDALGTRAGFDAYWNGQSIAQ